jgi:hypothetical protein
VDGRIKSGHDDSELHKGHCAFGSLPKFPGQSCAFVAVTVTVWKH